MFYGPRDALTHGRREGARIQPPPTTAAGDLMTKLIGLLACAGSLLLLMTALALGLQPAAAAPRGPSVNSAWVRLSPVPGRPAAGYAVIRAGAVAAELLGVDTPGARVEMHTMSMAGGVMRMDRLPAVRIAAGETMRFSPGGKHLMIFGLPATLRPGATLPLSFRFADGTRVEAAAVVRAAGDDGN